MSLKGWQEKYEEILTEFGYDKSQELKSATILNSILKTGPPIRKLERRIRNKTVFVIGAGPSLSSSLPYLKKFRRITKIVADGATKGLIENGIKPDVVVTDLDGNIEFLRRAADAKSVMVVHAHGDNIQLLPYAISFSYCIGTTEGKPFGKIRNFGGFTDGDRCVFLARYFGASRIILFGMDFGTRVGKYSKEGKYNKSVKQNKLKRGKSLLEWLATKDTIDLYTISSSITGFKRVKLADLQKLVRS